MQEDKLAIVEQFYSLQGEGANTGKASYFVRVGGCDVGCEFCDSKEAWQKDNFVKTDIKDIVANAKALPSRTVIITGGEPLLYDMTPLTRLFKQEGFETCLETSGTCPMSGLWDWICISAKTKLPPLEENMTLANELKIIICSESDFAFAEYWAQKVDKKKCLLYLQPEWSQRQRMMPRIVEYIKQNPKWRISLQSHKYMSIP